MRVWLMSACTLLGSPSTAMMRISPRMPSRGDSAVEPALDTCKKKSCGQARLLCDGVQVDAMFAHLCVPVRTREMRSAHNKLKACWERTSTRLRGLTAECLKPLICPSPCSQRHRIAARNGCRAEHALNDLSCRRRNPGRCRGGTVRILANDPRSAQHVADCSDCWPAGGVEFAVMNRSRKLSRATRPRQPRPPRRFCGATGFTELNRSRKFRRTAKQRSPRDGASFCTTKKVLVEFLLNELITFFIV
jgi:hypothetical protein